MIADLQDLSARLLSLCFDLAVTVAAERTVDGAIKDIDPFGAGIQAKLDDLSDEVRVGVGSKLRGPVPADVGFDNDNVTFGDKTAHATEGLSRVVNQFRRLTVLDPHDVGDRLAGKGR